MLFAHSTGRIFLVVAATLAAGGCCPGKSQSSAEVSASATSGTGTTAGALLQVSPVILRKCDLHQGVGVPVQVSWNVTALHVDSVKIWVRSPQGKDKLWVAGGAVGTERTGPWTFPGTTFSLTDGHDRALNRKVIRTEPCK